jgi:hypothetical protein
MGWMDDRDLLIAETLAFVKAVAPPQIKPPEPAQIVPVEQIKQILQAPPGDFEPPIFQRIVSLPSRNEREEIARRLASFKATQLRFQREREQYCSATLGDVLKPVSVPPRQPHP